MQLKLSLVNQWCEIRLSQVTKLIQNY